MLSQKEIRRQYEEIADNGGVAVTPSGKRVFIFRCDPYTGMCRVMYHPSGKKSDILVSKLTAVGLEKV
jgi:hypothetical protein